MHSSPLDMNALDNPSRLYRQELQGRYQGLRFSLAVERDFKAFLRETQAPNLVFCAWIGLALWVAVLGWDVLRYVQTIQGTSMQTLYLQTVPMTRLVGLLAIGGLLMGGMRRLWGEGLYVMALVTILVNCMGIFASGYIYNMAGTNEAMAASILVLIAVLFPCGLTLREVLPVGAVLLVAYWLAAWMIVSPQQWSEFCSISGLLMLCMGMMGLDSYLRERGMREQFLLRRLLALEARHDSLTGLANRRSFQRHFEICLAQAQRDGKTVLLTILDIDHFKLYNDHYGERAGDGALQQVALLLEHYAVRPMDLAIRLGGEEFGLLSYADDALSLKRRMQHLREQVQGLNIVHEYSPTASCLTVSMGIAQAEPTGTTDSLLQQADAQLHRAKKEGRNRVCGPDMPVSAAAGGALSAIA